MLSKVHQMKDEYDKKIIMIENKYKQEKKDLNDKLKK